MRKIFTLLTMCLLATAAWGQTVIEFTPGDPAGNNTTVSGPDEMTKGGITVSTTSGAFAADQYRFGKTSVTTFTSSVGNITSIEFTCTASGTTKYGPGGFAAQDGYSYEDKVGTWTGNASSVQFTAETNQVRATKIVVTVGGNGLSSPSFSPAAGTYYAPIEVTIKCGTSGAKVYYTSDGSEPTTSSTEFSAPIALSSNTTLKAISTKDGDVSDVVTAEYVFESATGVGSIAEYQNVDDGTVVAFTCPVYVLTQYGRYLYVTDKKGGYALFYGDCGQSYVNGDEIPAGFAGTKTTYNSEAQLTAMTGMQPAASNSPIAPESGFSASNVNHDNWGHLVLLENATITADGTNYTLTDANGNSCAIYFGSLGVSAPTDLTAQYNVTAIVGSYKTNYQLLPTALEKIGGGGGEGDYALGDLGDVEDGTTVTIKNDAIVLGQKGYYLYLKDSVNGFGLAYGSCGQTYSPGDVIPAGYGGEKTTYDMEPELKNLTGFQAASSNIGGVDALETAAETITISQVGHDTWGHYVYIKNVTIDKTNKTFTDATGTTGYYDRFAISWPDDETKTYNIYAIVGSYKTNYQLLPTRIVFEEVVPDVECLTDLYELSTGKKAHFTQPLTAIYQSKAKRDLYIQDACGNFGLVYGDVDGEFVNGDYINDAVASWTTYNNNKQLTPDAETFIVAGHGNEVAPEAYPIEEISQDMVHHYFYFENVQIQLVDENYYLVDETGEMMLFDRYSVGLAELDLTKNYNVWCFLTVFREVMELYPIKVEVYGEPTALDLYDVNHDGEINLADVNTLIDYILTGSGFHDCNLDGEMNIADINALIDYILNN